MNDIKWYQGHYGEPDRVRSGYSLWSATYPISFSLTLFNFEPLAALFLLPESLPDYVKSPIKCSHSNLYFSYENSQFIILIAYIILLPTQPQRLAVNIRR